MEKIFSGMRINVYFYVTNPRPMKTIPTILIAFTYSVAASQPTLTSANEAIPGITFNYIFIDTTGIQPGPSGANQIWDFSNVIPSGIASVQNWVDPSTTPYASSYPGSDICQVVDATGNPIYNYHTRNATFTQLDGIAYDAGLGPNIMVYGDPEVIRNFPATINNAWSDTYAGTSTQVLGPLTTTTYRYGYYEYVVDGYGTLITPSATYPNVLRMRLHQEFTDSTVYSGAPLPTVLAQHYSTTYFWASTDAGDRLYQFYIGYDTLVSTGSTTNFVSASYLDLSTGIQPLPDSPIHVSAFPNPASDAMDIQISSTFQGTCRIELIEITGRRVLAESRTVFECANLQRIDVSNVASGTYLLKLTGTGNLEEELLVTVQH
jgi:hypothetical protein